MAPSGTLPGPAHPLGRPRRPAATVDRAAPVLLAVDDAQWLDESSAAILAYAIRRLGEARSRCWSLSGRGPARPTASPLLAALTPDRTERVRVGAMPLASLHRLFQLRLGRSFPRLALVRIEAESRGNPLYALEIARALREAGIQLDPHAPLPIPDSFVRPDGHAHLGTAARHAATSCCWRPPPPNRRSRRSNVRCPGAEDALRPAIGGQLLMVDRGQRPVQPSTDRPGRARLGGARRLRRVHGILAGAGHVARCPGPPPRACGRRAGRSPSPETLADARGRREDPRRDPRRCRAVSRRRAGRRRWSRPDQRLERARLAAECLFIDLSEIVQSDGILEAALREAPPGPTRAEALSLRALLRYYHGRVPEAVAMGEQALAEAGPDDDAPGEDPRPRRVPRDAARPGAGPPSSTEAAALLEPRASTRRP